MADDLLERLLTSLTIEEKSVIVARILLEREPPILQDRIVSLAFLRWFDEPVVRYLLPETYRYNSSDIYSRLCKLPFIEKVPSGFAFNNLTRLGLLSKATPPQRSLAAKAVDAYKVRRSTESIVESIYCLVLGENKVVAETLFERSLFHLARSNDWNGVLALFQAIEEAESYVQNRVLTLTDLHLQTHNLANRKLIESYSSNFEQEQTTLGRVTADELGGASGYATKIGILFLAANPVDEEQLNLTREYSEIRDVLQKATLRQQFELTNEPAVRATELIQLCLQNQATIIHFSGHGNESGEIILEDPDGQGIPLSSEAVSSIFGTLNRDGNRIRCVVLSACFSERLAQLIVKHVDIVIGVAKTMGDEAAIRFSRGFYAALGESKDVQSAYDLACSNMKITRVDDNSHPFQLLCRGQLDAKTYFLL